MIQYVKGDATAPQGDGPKVIVHVCNNRGAWGAGFVVAISKRWPFPEKVYRQHMRKVLGEVEFVQADSELQIVVANMIAQDGFPSPGRPVAIDYAALRACLVEVANYCSDYTASVHMPRIGCGIAGGDWSKVSAIIEAELCMAGVAVTVYDLP